MTIRRHFRGSIRFTQAIWRNVMIPTAVSHINGLSFRTVIVIFDSLIAKST